eukprot:Blabericola_migrator_1__11646@NODE_700_length_6820_cov_37_868651_g509_i0_p1_GENE_NODE_700_length_6820_cov_37_868651_g509_i0NODE_700_length_6820_cov_37_868651_g509_i0_p1_ORF_typecomplete_len916_score126_37_NODE_700_length_6820_cov_37_868651_g509_i022254972
MRAEDRVLALSKLAVVSLALQSGLPHGSAFNSPSGFDSSYLDKPCRKLMGTLSTTKRQFSQCDPAVRVAMSKGITSMEQVGSVFAEVISDLQASPAKYGVNPRHAAQVHTAIAGGVPIGEITFNWHDIPGVRGEVLKGLLDPVVAAKSSFHQSTMTQKSKGEEKAFEAKGIALSKVLPKSRSWSSLKQALAHCKRCQSELRRHRTTDPALLAECLRRVAKPARVLKKLLQNEVDEVKRLMIYAGCLNDVLTGYADIVAGIKAPRITHDSNVKPGVIDSQVKVALHHLRKALAQKLHDMKGVNDVLSRSVVSKITQSCRARSAGDGDIRLNVIAACNAFIKLRPTAEEKENYLAYYCMMTPSQLAAYMKAHGLQYEDFLDTSLLWHDACGNEMEAPAHITRQIVGGWQALQATQRDVKSKVSKPSNRDPLARLLEVAKDVEMTPKKSDVKEKLPRDPTKRVDPNIPRKPPQVHSATQTDDEVKREITTEEEIEMERVAERLRFERRPNESDKEISITVRKPKASVYSKVRGLFSRKKRNAASQTSQFTKREGEDHNVLRHGSADINRNADVRLRDVAVGDGRIDDSDNRDCWTPEEDVKRSGLLSRFKALTCRRTTANKAAERSRLESDNEHFDSHSRTESVNHKGRSERSVKSHRRMAHSSELRDTFGPNGTFSHDPSSQAPSTQQPLRYFERSDVFPSPHPRHTVYSKDIRGNSQLGAHDFGAVNTHGGANTHDLQHGTHDDVQNPVLRSSQSLFGEEARRSRSGIDDFFRTTRTTQSFTPSSRFDGWDSDFDTSDLTSEQELFAHRGSTSELGSSKSSKKRVSLNERDDEEEGQDQRGSVGPSRLFLNMSNTRGSYNLDDSLTGATEPVPMEPTRDVRQIVHNSKSLDYFRSHAPRTGSLNSVPVRTLFHSRS